jgi:hypothetical protein
MTNTWNKIIKLIENGDIKIPEHGYDELAADGITVREFGGISRVPKRTMCFDHDEGLGGPSHSCRLGHSTCLDIASRFSHGVST